MATNLKDTAEAFKAFIESKPWDGVDHLRQLTNTLAVDQSKTRKLDADSAIITNLCMIVHQLYEDCDKVAESLVILRGPESSGKTGWLRCLVPDDFEDLILFSASPSTDHRALQAEVLTFPVVIYHEVERLLKKPEILKSIVSQKIFTRPIYQNAYALLPRRAALFGTLNLQTEICAAGSRRVEVIDICGCDIAALRQIDLQQVYAQIRAAMLKDVK